MQCDLIGLCHRCEHRAVHRETGRQPRCECGDPGAIGGCYMYMPVRPVGTRISASEKARRGVRRPRMPGYMSGREQAAAVAPDDGCLLTEHTERRAVQTNYIIPAKLAKWLLRQPRLPAGISVRLRGK